MLTLTPLSKLRRAGWHRKSPQFVMQVTDKYTFLPTNSPSAFLSTKEPNDQAQHHANEEGSGERQVEPEVVSLNDKVAGESAEPQLGKERPEEPCGN